MYNQIKKQEDAEGVERKDRKGKIIKKGSKIHHITFKDEIRIKDGNERADGDEKESDSDSNEEEGGKRADEGGVGSKQLSDLVKIQRKRRELLSDIIFVESYKEYN